MSNSTRFHSFVKPVVCKCEMIQNPVAPCEILDGKGLPGVLSINGTVYKVEIVGELPAAPAEPIVYGYTLDRGNGEIHALHVEFGRLCCSCGDFEFRRASQTERETMDCKHTAAIRKLLPLPVDLYEEESSNRLAAPRPAPPRAATPRFAPPRLASLRNAAQRNATFSPVRYEDDAISERCDVCGSDASDPRGCDCVRVEPATIMAAMKTGETEIIEGHEVFRAAAGWVIDGTFASSPKHVEALLAGRDLPVCTVSDSDFDNP